MGKLILAGVLVWGASALALEWVEAVTESFEGKTVRFERTSSGKYPIEITAEGKTLKVLDPRFTPKIATDGKTFYELNASLNAVKAIDIQDDGKLSTKRMDDSTEVEPHPSTRAQMAAYLLSQDRKARAKLPRGTEAFLLETEKLVGQQVYTSGFDAGSSVIANGKRFLVLGRKRYPTLLNGPDGIYFMSPDDHAPTRLLLPTTGKLEYQSKGKPAAAPPETQRAYFRFAADNWRDFTDAQRKALLPFFKRYFEAQGAGVKVQLEGIVMPSFHPEPEYVDENGKSLTADELKKRILNFVLNLIGSNDKPQPATEPSKGTYDLSAFLKPDALARIATRNPYQCDGSREQIRLDWLASAVLTDTFYRELTGIPDTLGELEGQLGLALSFAPQSKERSNSAAPVSGVAHVGRVGSVQPQKKRGNLEFFGTYDFAIDENGKLKQKKGNFKKNPHDFEYTGGEFIWQKKNRYPVFALYKGDGESLAAAPDSLVNDTESKLGPFIKNPASCLQCHRNMMRTPEEYTFEDPSQWMLSQKEFEQDLEAKAQFKTYQAYKQTVEKYYGPAEKFIERTEKVKEGFLSALKESKAFVGTKEDPTEPIALLPDLYRRYNSNLSYRIAAQELGATYEEIKRIIPPSGRVDTFPEYPVEILSASDEHMTRQQFENIYCELKKRLETLRRSPPESPDEKTH